MKQESPVSISEASHILGVSGAALRQWTDEGKIKACISPSSHRRYSKADLKKFMGSHRKAPGIKDLVVKLKNTLQLHQGIARTSLNTTSRYNQPNQESQERLASLGQHLLGLIIKYITEPSQQNETIKLAHDIDHNSGETLAKLGIPLTDSMEAFILHRDPLLKAATQLVRKREVSNGRVVEAIPLVVQIMDEALVSLVAAHQQYQNSFQNESKGGAPA